MTLSVTTELKVLMAKGKINPPLKLYPNNEIYKEVLESFIVVYAHWNYE